MSCIRYRWNLQFGIVLIRNRCRHYNSVNAITNFARLGCFRQAPLRHLPIHGNQGQLPERVGRLFVNCSHHFDQHNRTHWAKLSSRWKFQPKLLNSAPNNGVGSGHFCGVRHTLPGIILTRHRRMCLQCSHCASFWFITTSTELPQNAI